MGFFVQAFSGVRVLPAQQLQQQQKLWQRISPTQLHRLFSSSSTDATEITTETAPPPPSKPARPNRILSGVQPTGSLHLGNYLGAIQQWVALQDTAETFFCVVDYHAITVQPHDPAALYESTLTSAALYLAAGIDPNRSKIFVQSHVPAHAELTWLLQCLTPVSWLERMIQYKEKSAKNSTSASTGLLTYPVLMAADILLYQANLVPVGEDQRQHLELARDICRRVHDQYGKGNAYKKRLKKQGLPTYPLFTEPQALILNGTTARVMSLTDGTKKMSKSDPAENSRINLLDPPDVMRTKIKSAKTDNGFDRLEIHPDRPEATNLLQLYCAVQPDKDREELLESVADLQWGQFKPLLADALIAHVEPIQQKYHAIRKDEARLREILREGAVAASQVADATLERTRAALGFFPEIVEDA